MGETTMALAVLVLSTILGATASLFFKKSSGSDSIVSTLKNPNLYIGGGIYLVAAFASIWILRYLEYSEVLPLTSMTYIWTMILSAVVLKEKISGKKIIGVICIVIGASCIAAGT
ncbi:hypothetical protein FACS1894111_03470 [Clostridia bacterium]|nr:hypothetical protein FACS1894111_03470 [Clostridia bacterium]